MEITHTRNRRSTVFILQDEEENQIQNLSPQEQHLIDNDKQQINQNSKDAQYDPEINSSTANLQSDQEQSKVQDNSPLNNKDQQKQQQNTKNINSTRENTYQYQYSQNRKESEELFERAQSRRVQEIKNIINPESKLLKTTLKKHHFVIEQLEGEAFLNLANVSIQNQKCHEKGKLLITNYRFAFFIGSKLKVDVPLGYIERVSVREDKSTVLLEIFLKHSPVWRFKYENKNEGLDADNMLELYSFPSKITYFFAFSHYRGLIKKPQNIVHYNFQKQYLRFGMLQNGKYKKIDNFDGSICSTYPSQLMVPAEADEEMVRNVAKARERERFPVATYCVRGHNNNATYTLWRGSQLKSSEVRSLSDVEYINILSYWSSLVIVEARTKQNSKDNIQTSELYKNSKIEYLNLDPITSIKNAYYKVIEACIGNEPKKFIKEVNDSKWYQQIKSLLIGASVIVHYLTNQKNVLVHCGDGWDRTSQLCALAMLIIDPYFRTLEGFVTLIEKQFISFGDPFYLRLGLRGRSQQQIPVFIQFLDCVVQIMHQYPLSFQFSIKYVTLLSNYIYTNRFGNFLCSSKNEMYEFKVRENTLSIWEELKKDPLALNPYYLNSSQIGIYQLSLNIQSRVLRCWRQHFFYLTTNLKDNYKMHPYAEDNYDYIKLLHDQLRLQTDSLRKKVSEQFKFIMTLKQSLSELSKPRGLLEQIE